MWKGISKNKKKEIGKILTMGDDLRYGKKEKITWDNLQGTVVSINMNGWGKDMNRRTLWEMMNEANTMIAVIVDHRRRKQQIGTI